MTPATQKPATGLETAMAFIFGIPVALGIVLLAAAMLLSVQDKAVIHASEQYRECRQQLPVLTAARVHHRIPQACWDSARGNGSAAYTAIAAAWKGHDPADKARIEAYLGADKRLPNCSWWRCRHPHQP